MDSAAFDEDYRSTPENTQSLPALKFQKRDLEELWGNIKDKLRQIRESPRLTLPEEAESINLNASAGFGESSTDLVFAGKAFIAESGRLMAETKRFSLDEKLIIADVDIELLEFQRQRNTSFRINACSLA